MRVKRLGRIPTDPDKHAEIGHVQRARPEKLRPHRGCLLDHGGELVTADSISGIIRLNALFPPGVNQESHFGPRTLAFLRMQLRLVG